MLQLRPGPGGLTGQHEVRASRVAVCLAAGVCCRKLQQSGALFAAGIAKLSRDDQHVGRLCPYVGWLHPDFGPGHAHLQGPGGRPVSERDQYEAGLARIGRTGPSKGDRPAGPGWAARPERPIRAGVDRDVEYDAKVLGLQDTGGRRPDARPAPDDRGRGTGGQTAQAWSSAGCSCWTTLGDRLTSAGVTAAQVSVAWIKEADASPTSGWPTHASALEYELAAILSVAAVRFPNLRLVYLSSRIYGGYAVGSLNPEPYALSLIHISEPTRL